MTAQTLNFPVKSYGNCRIIEPGDGTKYKFLVVQMPKEWHGDWAPERGPFVAISSIDGPLFPGITLPIALATEWWYDTSAMSPLDSLEHRAIKWVVGENFRVKVNPWTVRAAFLMILKEIDNE